MSLNVCLTMKIKENKPWIFSLTESKVSRQIVIGSVSGGADWRRFTVAGADVVNLNGLKVCRAEEV